MERAVDKILNPELIVRYLLGEILSESQQAEIERRLFADDEFLEGVQAIELQLMARYLRNDLSPREHELFESHFLLSQERRNALEFVRGVSNKLDSETGAHTNAPETLLASFVDNRSPSRLHRSPFFSWTASFAGFAARPIRAAVLVIPVVLLALVVSWSFRSQRNGITVSNETATIPSQLDSVQKPSGAQPESGNLEQTKRTAQEAKTNEAPVEGPAPPKDDRLGVPPIAVTKITKAESRGRVVIGDVRQTAVAGGGINVQIGNGNAQSTAVGAPSRSAGSPDRDAQKDESFVEQMERQAITDVLSRYKSAYESKDLAGIKTVFPSLAGREETATVGNFRLTKTIQLSLEVTGILISNNSARTAVQFQISALFLDGARNSSPTSPIVFNLRKLNGSWIIESIDR